jgi:hypothetical protein
MRPLARLGPGPCLTVFANRLCFLLGFYILHFTTTKYRQCYDIKYYACTDYTLPPLRTSKELASHIGELRDKVYTCTPDTP